VGSGAILKAPPPWLHACPIVRERVGPQHGQIVFLALALYLLFAQVLWPALGPWIHLILEPSAKIAPVEH